MELFFDQVMNGVGTGVIYASVALALVLIYRTTGLLNFAQGEMGMLTGEPRSATVVACTDVDCYRLDKVGFAKVLLARPSMAEEISTVLTQRRLELDSRVKQAAQALPRSHSEDLLARIKSFFGVGS